MRFFFRLQSALQCLIRGYAAIPLTSYNTICISEDSLLLTNGDNQKSVEVALWALERPEHYWRATTLGQSVHSKAVETMEISKVDN